LFISRKIIEKHQAEKKAYGENVVASGPMYKNFVVKGKDIIISFTGTGLGLATRDTGSLKGFAVAGDDKKFFWATARIEGDKVIVSSDKVNVPVAVR